MPIDRRSFLQLLGAGAATAAFPSGIARALQIPAARRTGTLADVEHIVILMQENRSFDHYYGSLNGVRGFHDPRAVLLPSGKPVWYQPDRAGAHPGGDGHLLPFHPDAPDLGLQFLEDLAHDWTTTHEAWNNGHHDGWVAKKGPTTMAHLTRSDIPYHYALADAFTICDAYHCSLMGPTDPNRYYMFSGWVGNDGQGGGPVVGNEEAGYSWGTFPERLHQAGVSWKIYQDIGRGISAKDQWGQTEDPYIGNYGDNSLLFFKQYEQAPAGTPLHAGAKLGTELGAQGAQPLALFSHFRQDVLSGRLPQVSWVVAPEAYSEHPNWPANYGAWYVSQILDALTADPAVWSKTALLITYDENDGFFDHMPPITVPPTPAHGRSLVDTRHELYPGSAHYPAGPYGMGIRVPMLVVSPWSKGGWVNSQVFDHSSMIRFIEARFRLDTASLHEPNITPWRRAVAGDLTSAFNFATPNDATVPLPTTIAYKPLDTKRHPDYKPTPPAVQAMPAQEPGGRALRALPYVLEASFVPSAEGVTLHMSNNGSVAAVFQLRAQGTSAATAADLPASQPAARSAHQSAAQPEDQPGTRPGPWTWTLAPGDTHSELLPGTAFLSSGLAELTLHGPAGFYRSFRGPLQVPGFEAQHAGQPARLVSTLTLVSRGGHAAALRITDRYSGRAARHTLAAGKTLRHEQALARSHGWYDLTVEDGETRYEFAGHVENGQDSQTDPLLERVPKAESV